MTASVRPTHERRVEETHEVGATYRIFCDVAQRWFALLAVVLCGLQIGFAGSASGVPR